MDFNMRIVGTGERYGRGDQLVNEHGPMIEFFDASTAGDERFDFSPSTKGLGQFVSRYYVSTLLEQPSGRGIALYGGEPAWTLTAEQVARVVAELRVLVALDEALAEARAMEDARGAVRG